MKKTYCDTCKKEFTKADHKDTYYLVSKKDKAAIALKVWGDNGYISHDDMCNSCAIDIINNGELMNETEFDKHRARWDQARDKQRSK